jgi:hypothetical protein
MTIDSVSLGYWYQRTTLHLSELYDFLHDGVSPLNLNKNKLHDLRSALAINEVELKIDALEYIDLKVNHYISIKIYEDGLTVLTKRHTEIDEDIKALTDYFEKKFSPAVSYLFSLGAPVPKELSNIKTISPFFIVTHGGTDQTIGKLFQELHEEKYYEITGDNVQIYRGTQYFIINADAKFKNTENLIEAQILFKEFKSQLHHYLNLHRVIWEKIADIKEQGYIRGRNIQDQRNELESYKKTVELIEGRMNQMGIHIGTRQAMIKSDNLEQVLNDTLQFKYENLKDTLSYVKTLWIMTKNYVDSAIQVFSEINAQSTKNSIQALTLITTLGLLHGIINYFTLTKFPQIHPTGIIYFIFLVVATWLVNQAVVVGYRLLRYKITNITAKKSL